MRLGQSGWWKCFYGGQQVFKELSGGRGCFGQRDANSVSFRRGDEIHWTSIFSDGFQHFSTVLTDFGRQKQMLGSAQEWWEGEADHPESPRCISGGSSWFYGNWGRWSAKSTKLGTTVGDEVAAVLFFEGGFDRETRGQHKEETINIADFMICNNMVGFPWYLQPIILVTNQPTHGRNQPN